MAGTVTVAETRIKGQPVQKIDWDWLSTAAGAADLVTANVYNGILTHVVFIPDGGGTQPTDQYDVTVTNPDGVDVLNGNGANLSNAANVIKSRYETANLLAVANEPLTLNVTNAGNAKGGRVVLYIRVGV